MIKNVELRGLDPTTILVILRRGDPSYYYDFTLPIGYTGRSQAPGPHELLHGGAFDKVFHDFHGFPNFKTKRIYHSTNYKASALVYVMILRNVKSARGAGHVG